MKKKITYKRKQQSTKKQEIIVKLKQRQDEILQLLIYFRFLNTKHFQHMLNHKDEENIRKWLNELVEKKYINKFYSRQFAGKSAYFCLDKGSIPYFREYQFKGMHTQSLNWIYAEKALTKGFQKHNMRIADIYLSLDKLTKNHGSKLNFTNQKQLRAIKYLPLPLPDAYFAITEKNKQVKRYFLEIYDQVYIGDELKEKIKQYFYYHKKKFWQNHTTKSFPEFILVFQNPKVKNHAYRIIQSKLKYQEEPSFYLTTLQEINEHELSKKILQKVEV